MRPIFSILAMLLIVTTATITAAKDCDTDCNKKCCRTVSITPLDKNRICEPQCKLSCEASKRICKGTGVQLPTLPSVVNELEKVCAAGFDTVMRTVIAAYTGQTSFVPMGSSKAFDEPKRILIETELYSAKEFDGVDIRFCRLTGNSTGLTYDRDKICITDRYNGEGHLRDLAKVLSHEMFHVRQYRSRGTDNFKCEYSKQLVRGKFEQGRNMDMERDAYEFEDRATVIIDSYLRNTPPTSSTTYMQTGRGSAEEFRRHEQARALGLKVDELAVKNDYCFVDIEQSCTLPTALPVGARCECPSGRKFGGRSYGTIVR